MRSWRKAPRRTGSAVTRPSPRRLISAASAGGKVRSFPNRIPTVLGADVLLLVTEDPRETECAAAAFDRVLYQTRRTVRTGARAVPRATGGRITMHREEHGWTSAALGRSMRLLWYGHAGRPILAFPTSMGHAGQNEDLGLIGGLGDRIGRGEVQFCCVDAIDEETWYNRTVPVADRVRRHDLYDRFLAQE